MLLNFQPMSIQTGSGLPAFKTQAQGFYMSPIMTSTTQKRQEQEPETPGFMSNSAIRQRMQQIENNPRMMSSGNSGENHNLINNIESGTGGGRLMQSMMMPPLDLSNHFPGVAAPPQ